MILSACLAKGKGSYSAFAFVVVYPWLLDDELGKRFLPQQSCSGIALLRQARSERFCYGIPKSSMKRRLFLVVVTKFASLLSLDTLVTLVVGTCPKP